MRFEVRAIKAPQGVTAFSLEASVPLIYPRLKPEGTGPRGIEGRFQPRMRALLIDLRDSTGGDVAAALELSGDFLPPGALLST